MERLSVDDKDAVQNFAFDILVTNLNVLHSYFNVQTKLFSDLYF